MASTALPTTSVTIAVRTLLDTWQQGRKVLVVLGAGASVAARVPLMNVVFGDLRKRVEDFTRSEEGQGRAVPAVFREIQANLDALERGDGPRALAAMALGTLQKAHSRSAITDSPHASLARIWNEFSADFIDRKIKSAVSPSPKPVLDPTERFEAQAAIRSHPFASQLRTVLNPLRKVDLDESSGSWLPTNLHRLVARWAIADWARLVSVNFDGLTHRALVDESSDQGAALVLSDPGAVKNFAFGAPTNARRSTYVIKVWGDVFHAVCTNPRCPEAGKRVPMFRLPRPVPADAHNRRPAIYDCSACGEPRQLQIFFTGYEEKEKATHELMEEILRVVAPEIGCVLTVGFSGLWDHALVRLVVTLGALVDRENKATAPAAVSCVCIDPDIAPPIAHNLETDGVRFCHVQSTAEEFASVFELDQASLPVGRTDEIPRFNHDKAMEDGLWTGENGDSGLSKMELTQALPSAYEDVWGHRDYMEQAARLRQLGIKTRVSMAMQQSRRRRIEEKDHNRRMHSRGAAHLAALWFRKLAKPLKDSGALAARNEETLCAIAVFAALHHDLGHLPFTHLAEEIFDELHWTLTDWISPFKHDEPVLAEPYVAYGPSLDKAINATATRLGLDPSRFRHAAECALQGRSGYPWLDAILNSPLDVDKLDYVFRDCLFLDQQLHIPAAQSGAWVMEFFNETRVLPSGLVALEGTAGTHARDFLEERWWLYRRQYLRPGFRALERLARAVIIQWLLRVVPPAVGKTVTGERPSQPMRDPSADKGRQARASLWQKLMLNRDLTHGEPQLLLEMIREMKDQPTAGMPQSPRVKEWAERCLKIFDDVFGEPPTSGVLPGGSLTRYLRDVIGITCSENCYVRAKDFTKVREIARTLETARPYRALIDVAIFPRMLAYPVRRRFNWNERETVGDCFAVSHEDPGQWGNPTNRWIPLSQSAFAERDKEKLARIMVVSPFPDDPEVWHMLDRFRNECRRCGIQPFDIDPEKVMFARTQ